MSVVSFQNEGLVDLTAVKTFGVSVKENENPIGYFGTGLKYAVAVLLREGASVVLHRGTKKHVFSTKRKKVRGKPFEVVHLDGHPLGFTTELGKNWELWMAFRELHCNAQDEGGFTTNRRLQAKAGHTTVVVSGCEEFALCYENRSRFFVETSPLHVGAKAEVHPGGGHSIFYRGIRVYQSQQHALFNYNVTRPIVLTEDRTAKHTYELASAIAETLMHCENEAVLEKVLMAPEGTLEHALNFRHVGCDPGGKFMETVERLSTSSNSVRLNRSALDVMAEHSGKGKALAKELEPTSEQVAMIEQAYVVIEKLGYDAVRDLPVKLVLSLGVAVLGQAHEGVVYLTERAFKTGQRCVTGTLLEEYLHVKMSFEDESRDFQNYLIDALVAQGEWLVELNAERRADHDLPF